MRISVIMPIIGAEDPDDSAFRAFDECIVVDGGSLDGVPDRARRQGATVLISPPGRALQMNAGASMATGDILLFLHADTRLPADAASRIRSAIGSGAIGGCFQTAFDHDHWLLKVGDFWRNLRARWLAEFYGDQSIFIRRDVFIRLGGYRPLRVLEDFDLCSRMRRLGRLAYVASPAVTSARKFLGRGIVRTWLRHQTIKARHLWESVTGCSAGRPSCSPPPLAPITRPSRSEEVTL